MKWQRSFRVLIGFFAGVGAYHLYYRISGDGFRWIGIHKGMGVGWTDFISSNKTPKLWFVSDPKQTSEKAPRLTFMCNAADFVEVNVIGFEAAQAFPQPDMKIEFGGYKLDKTPVASSISDASSNPNLANLSFEFLPEKEMIRAIGKAVPITVSFKEKKIQFPAAPSAMASNFAEACISAIYAK